MVGIVKLTNGFKLCFDFRVIEFQNQLIKIESKSIHS